MIDTILWVPFLSLLWREIRRFLRVFFQTVVTPLINSSLYLLIFGVSLGESISLPGNQSYLSFLIPGLVMMAALNNAYQNASGSIVTAKFCGELEDLKASPLSRCQIIWALSIGSLIRGLVVATVTLAVGECFHVYMEGTWLLPKHPLLLLFFLIVGSLTFARIGIWLAFWAQNLDQLAGIGSFVLLPLLYLGGVFFSVESLHPVWQSISRANPVLYFISGVRYGVLGQADVAVGTAALVSIGALILMDLLALRSIRTGSFDRW